MVRGGQFKPRNTFLSINSIMHKIMTYGENNRDYEQCKSFLISYNRELISNSQLSLRIYLTSKIKIASTHYV